MNDFDFEVAQKKRIASGAYHRKNGSKSHACTLPSDRLTEAQRRKLDGPVTTLKLNEPMTWADFLALSEEHKRLYLSHLMELYHPSAAKLAEMFGTSCAAVSQHLRLHDLPRGKAKVHPSYTAEQRAAWAAFCGRVVGGKPGAPAAEEEQGDVPVITEEPPLETEIGAEEDVTPAAITRLDITYTHVHSWEELYALLQRFGPIADRTVRVIVE
jgi:hypothetical protein